LFFGHILDRSQGDPVKLAHHSRACHHPANRRVHVRADGVGDGIPDLGIPEIYLVFR
jgi:hypothetical protein